MPAAAPATPAAGNSNTPNAASSGTGTTGTGNTQAVGGTVLNNPVAVSGGAQIQWQGPAQSKAGDIFALQLMMQSDQPVINVPAAIGFDPRVLQVVGVTEGDFLKRDGAQTSFTSRVDPNGQVVLTGTRAGDNGATALGALTSRAVIPSTGTSILVLLGVCAANLILGLGPLRVVTVPMIDWMRAAGHGPSAFTHAFQALAVRTVAWAAAATALYAWLRRTRP